MKFLCPNCKAKYQISEEKIAGRTLKMDCRRCNHAIVIRGDKSNAPRKSRSSSSASRPSYAGPAPARPSSGRGSLGADFRKNAAAAPPMERPTALDQWHVAINDVPVGPMKRNEIARKIATGAVTKESLAWREGLDDWRPIKNIPDLAPLLRRTGAPPTAKQKPPLPPPPARPLSRGPKPVRAGRPPTGRQPAAPKRRDASRPAARGNVVPIGGRLGGAAAPVFEELPGDFDDDEPTRVGSAIDFEKLEAEAGLDRERLAREREERDREERAAQARRDADARAEDARAAEEAAAQEAAAQAAAREAAAQEAAAAQEGSDQAPAGLVGASHIAHSDAFDPFASQAGASQTPAPFAQPPAEAAAPAASVAPVATAVPLDAAPAERRRRAIPIGAWIAIAGAASFGVVLAVMVGTYYLSPPAPVAATQPAPAPPAPPPERQLEVDPTLVEETAEAPAEETTEATDPTTEDVAAPATPRRGTRPAGTTGTRPRNGAASGENGDTARRGSRQTELDPEAQARLARFAGSDTDRAPNLDVDRPRTGLPGQEARSRASTELTSDQIRAVVRREGSGVQRCYETFARQSGQAPAMRIDVDVTIGGSGTVTRAVARGRSFGTVGQCIERTVRRWRFPRTGAESRVSIPFVFTGRD